MVDVKNWSAADQYVVFCLLADGCQQVQEFQRTVDMRLKTSLYFTDKQSQYFKDTGFDKL